jgi:hypothetical protein
MTYDISFAFANPQLISADLSKRDMVIVKISDSSKFKSLDDMEVSSKSQIVVKLPK